MTYDGQVTSDPMRYINLDFEYIKARWDFRAERWDSDLSDTDSHLNRCGSYQRYLEILDSILKTVSSKNEKTFLDLGCGTGALLEFCSKMFRKSYGIDISDKMLQKAKEKRILNTEFVQDDCFHFLKQKQTFDFIASRGVLLSHYGKENSVNLLKSIYASLANDGIAFLDALSKDCSENPKEKYLFSVDEIKDMANSVGFQKVAVHSESKYPLIYLEVQR